MHIVNRPDKTILRFFLAPYRSQGPLSFQKARIQLLLLLICIALLPSFIIHDFVSDGSFEPTLSIPVSTGIVLLIGLLFVLRRGRYLMSAHLFLTLCFTMIWYDMFFAAASADGSISPITRLDTIVLLLCVLLMVPLLTNQRGLLIHFAINFLILLVFVQNNPEAEHLTSVELKAYASDALVAVTVTGVVALLLMRTFARSRRRLERANVNLEAKARHRTSALRKATEQLKHSRDELQKDLAMARQMQQNMILTPPPALGDWDIALYFQPIAEVSGDFYDFYTRDANLRGVALFDVSGHGVASGLITVLARSILSRYYESSSFTDPADVLYRANDELIEELRNTGHFLSGVLMQMKGDLVEYANAGHSDVLLSRAGGDTGPAWESSGTSPATEPTRGNLMGIGALLDRYPTVQCRVHPGDALLLYSDGIIEAVNEDLESFGLERLTSTLQTSAGQGDARDRLNRLLAEHANFMGGRACEDDLTVILLVKK